MLVYVISKHGKPLIPCNPQKARRLLKEQKAKVVKRTPFTIQLLYGSSKLIKLLDSFMGSSCLTKSNIRENHASYLEDTIVDTFTSESSTERKCMLQ